MKMSDALSVARGIGLLSCLVTVAPSSAVAQTTPAPSPAAPAAIPPSAAPIQQAPSRQCRPKEILRSPTMPLGCLATDFSCTRTAEGWEFLIVRIEAQAG